MLVPRDEFDVAYLKQIEHLSFQPVFVVGPHRSGTTIFCRVLLSTGQFNGATTYHIVNQRRLLHLHLNGLESQARGEIVKYFEKNGVRNRVYDDVETTPDMPEEYCFALAHQGRRTVLNRHNLASFGEFCRKLQFIQGPGRPLLLKSPFDTTNFLFIARSFPHARFLFIHRHPAEVISSQLKAIRSVLAKENQYLSVVSKRYHDLFLKRWPVAIGRWIYSERFPLLYSLVSSGIGRSCDYILKNIGRLGSDALSITYSDLCEDPNKTVSDVLMFLGMRELPARDYSDLMSPRKAVLSPEVLQRLNKIEKRNAKYCRQFGVGLCTRSLHDDTPGHP